MSYSPATNLVAGHGHAIAEKVYRRKGLDRLMKKMRFHIPAEMDVLELQNGNTVQWFRDPLTGTNTTATAEGTVGTGITAPAGSNITATVSQYADYMTFSDMLVDTALDRRVVVHSESMGYRAALSNDTIVRTVIDSGAQSQTPLNGAAGTIKRTDFAAMKSLFSGSDIMPLQNGMFYGLISPYITYDLKNDVSAGSIQDLMKYTNPKEAMLSGDRDFVCATDGFEIYESTNVKLTAGSPNTYRVYGFAKGGFGITDLAGRGPSRVVDPKSQRFNVTVANNLPKSLADPEGKIRSFISYNYVFTSVILDSTNKRIRYIDVSSSLGV